MNPLWYPLENAQMDASGSHGRQWHLVLLLLSDSVHQRMLDGRPWYPSENAQMDASGPIPLSCAQKNLLVEILFG